MEVRGDTDSKGQMKDFLLDFIQTAPERQLSLLYYFAAALK